MSKPGSQQDEEDLIPYTSLEVSSIARTPHESIGEPAQKPSQLIKPKRKVLGKNDGVFRVSPKSNQSQPPLLSAFHEAETVDSKISLMKPGCLTDLDSIDIMQMPMDFNDVENLNILEDITGFGNSKIPELIQDTHACFLSLIRDILCSTSDHRMTLTELRRKVSLWMCNPITTLNEWFSQMDNWLDVLMSAIHFLTGEFEDQPEDFVPYIEFKSHLNIYQWIGAGRDTDNHLIPLCKYWLSRRNEMGTSFSTSMGVGGANKFVDTHHHHLMDDLMSEMSSSPERSFSPPPLPRYPTNWTVIPASREEVEAFRAQERRRYENPHMAFTYRQHGYESVVGPVKGIYTQAPGISRARGHNMLVADRPNFVTILTLVRDATARLPNGEGTRADICELLKSSQYISPTATDQILQTIVSGALDRMHTEYDPCVKYDAKHKMWIYLHRDRSEEEFEKLHLQQQGTTKHKKPVHRKNKLKTIRHLKPNEPVAAAPKIIKKKPPKPPPGISTGGAVLVREPVALSEAKKTETKLKSANDYVLKNIITTPIQKTPDGLKKMISPNLISTPSGLGGKINIIQPPAVAKPNTQTIIHTKPSSFITTVQLPTAADQHKEPATKRIIQINPPILATPPNARLQPAPSEKVVIGGGQPNKPPTTIIQSPNIQTFVQLNKPSGSAATAKTNIVTTSNITLQKGQTILSASQQKQIVQTIISQQQAQKQQQQQQQQLKTQPQGMQQFIKTYTIPTSVATGGNTSTAFAQHTSSAQQQVTTSAAQQNVPKIIHVFKGAGGRLHPINTTPTTTLIHTPQISAPDKVSHDYPTHLS